MRRKEHPVRVERCRIGEQRAGWPLPVLIDSPGGGSPTNGWGKLGPEDPPIISTFLLDTLFYSILLWVAFSIVRAVRRQALPMKLMAVSLPLTAVAGGIRVAHLCNSPGLYCRLVRPRTLLSNPRYKHRTEHQAGERNRAEAERSSSLIL